MSILNAILERVQRLPPMPQAAAALLEATSRPEIGVARLAKVLRNDPGMAANILRVANSSYYGGSSRRGQVTSIEKAVALLGVDQISRLTVSLLSSRYLSQEHSAYALSRGELWKKSVACAVAAEISAGTFRYPHPNTAYTAGLLLDVGKIVLAEFLGPVLEGIRKAVADEGLSWLAAERKALGVTHAEVGGLLLQKWGFPEILAEAVRTHHEPSLAKGSPALAHLVHLADVLTVRAGVGLGADGLAYPVDEQTFQMMKIGDQEQMERLVAQLLARLDSAGALLTL